MKTLQSSAGSTLIHKVKLSAMLMNLGHTVVGALILAFLSGRNGSSI